MAAPMFECRPSAMVTEGTLDLSSPDSHTLSPPYQGAHDLRTMVQDTSPSFPKINPRGYPPAMYTPVAASQQDNQVFPHLPPQTPGMPMGPWYQHYPSPYHPAMYPGHTPEQMVHPFMFMPPVVPTQGFPYFSKDSFQHRNAKNELRAAIFEKVLSTFPKLQKMLAESSKPNLSAPENFPNCRYANQSRPEPSLVPPSIFLPSLPSEEIDDEIPYPGPRLSPLLMTPSFSPVMDMSPYLTQLIDQAMDRTPDLDDIIDSSSSSNTTPNKSDPEDYSFVPIKPEPVTDTSPSSINRTSCDFSRPSCKRSNITTKNVCEICHKIFSSKANLRVHMRRHSGEKPFQCEWCGKAFNQRSTLRTHVRIHTGERPYCCSMCDKSFADYSTFTKHQRTHTGEKPYSCNICGKQFAQSGNMIRHRQTHDRSSSDGDLSPPFGQ